MGDRNLVNWIFYMNLSIVPSENMSANSSYNSNKKGFLNNPKEE